MRRRTLLITLIVAAGGLTGAVPASAQQNPPGCNANLVALDIIRDKSVVRNGDVINYWVDVSNQGALACDASNVSIWLQFPAPNGNPSTTFQSVVRNARYDVPTRPLRFGPFAYTVQADPGVIRLEARTSIIRGLLHDLAVPSPFNADKTIGSTVLRPSITIDKVGSITGPLPAPQPVTYTYYVRNGTTPANPPTDENAISNVTVSDDLCPNPSAPTPNRGDADQDNKLDTDETWEFTCDTTHTEPGTYVNTAVARGENILYNVPVPVESPPDTWTVVLTPPAPPAPQPQAAVRPARAAQAPCTVKTPDSLRVRARELTTIRVRTRNIDRGTLVRITLPGGRVLRDRVGRNGVAEFRVRPPRSGTARIKAVDCADIERLTVRQARRVEAQRVPRVTG